MTTTTAARAVARPRTRADHDRAPAPTAHLAHDLAPVLPGGLDPDPSDGPQSQGDAIVLPWETFMSPHIRHEHTRAARPLPARGVWLLGSHLLLTETGPAPVRWLPVRGTRPGLGTLVVPDGCVARLAHAEHADLRIGPGVYVIRRQRTWEGTSPVLVFD